MVRVSSRFTSCHFQFHSPKLTNFTILRLHDCKMWKITALIWEISSWRLVEKFHISAFHMYYSQFNWIGEHEITNPKKIFASNPGRRTQKQAQKNMSEMEWHKMDYVIFLAMRMRKRHLFCISSHHEKQQEGGWVWKWVCLLQRVRNC